MRYSQEFKDNVVARLLSKELSISEAVEQYSIGKSTISYWLRIARESKQVAASCPTKPQHPSARTRSGPRIKHVPHGRSKEVRAQNKRHHEKKTGGQIPPDHGAAAHLNGCCINHGAETVDRRINPDPHVT